MRLLSVLMSVPPCNYHDEFLHIRLVVAFSVFCLRDMTPSSLPVVLPRAEDDFCELLQRAARAGRRGARAEWISPLFYTFPVGSIPDVCAQQKATIPGNAPPGAWALFRF